LLRNDVADLDWMPVDNLTPRRLRLKSIIWMDIIHGMDIKHFDLNLLRVFDALLTEGQVTLAGKNLNRSQNTVSAALSRLRDAFEDPLFVRAGRRMEPTEKAKALSNSVQEALHQVGRALAARFDPSTARRDFRILGTDYVSVLLIPQLMAKIRERAPGIDLRLVDISRRDPTVDFGQGLMHFAIEPPRDVPTLRTAFLLSDDYVVIVRRSQAPKLGRRKAFPLQDYCRRIHVLHSVEGNARGNVDETLAAAGLHRRVGLSLPHFIAIANTVSQTDMVATIPRKIAEHVARLFDLAVLEHPLQLSSISIMTYWHPNNDSDPAHLWMRQRISELGPRLTPRL
jgi:DNA-binding transcriptional LysR family regulator